jgi:ATP synthase protein I
MSENSPENDDLSPVDKALKERLNALDAKLQNQHKEAAEKAPFGGAFAATPLNATTLRYSRISTELLVGICAGLGFGWLLDNWLETRPLFMLLLAFIGFGAGIYNVWRLMNGRTDKVGLKD